ncbi:MAG TPA: Trk system potassium transporter TrkA [Myxococcota bacterium]|nr:Trk system potassium transporter TrkA [Myxococcota bacterium]
MRIVIVGGGLVGETLAGKLASDGHDISLVENDAATARALDERLDVQVVQGNGAKAPVLRAAGIEEAELVVAMSNSDETNMIVGLLAASLFRVSHIVVRLRDPEHMEGFSLVSREHPFEHVCVDPEAAAVDRITSLLEVPSALDVVEFMDGRLLMVAFRIGPESDFVDQPVAFMALAFAGTPAVVAAIDRSGHWLVPGGEEEIRADDIVYFAIAREHLEDVVSLVGVPEERRRTVMVGGASRIGINLAKRLEGGDARIVLIEQDPDLAQAAADQLESTLVVCGRVTDRSLLEEVDVDRVATFVAATPDHEINLVSCLLAKRLGAARAFSLVDNPALVNLMGDIGIDAIISPRLLAIGLTLQHIRGAGVRSVAPLLEDRVEVVEAEAVKGSPITRAPISEVGLERGILIAALRRGDQLLLPSGHDRVEAGDLVLMITTTDQASKVTRYLSP